MKGFIKYQFLLLILILCVSFITFGQTDFYKIYTNNGTDFGEGIVQLEDSSYVITGCSSSFKDGPSQAFLLKIDSLGNRIWSKDYGGLESEGGRRVMYKKNVGFYIAGYTNSIGNGGFDNYLVKTDESGNFLWQKSYGGPGWEKVNDAVLLADTSIIMVGQTNSGTAGNNDIYIVKTDKNGDTLWTKRMGGLGEDLATSIRILNGSTVIIGGEIYVSDSLKQKAYLVCLNVNGTIQWEHYYGNDGDYKINDLCIVGTEINIIGYRKNKIPNDYDGYSAKVGITGNFIYEFAYSSPNMESYEQISQYLTVDKLFIAYNQINSGTYTGGKDLYLGRFRGDLVYDNHELGISSYGDDIPGQIIPTNDGGVILVGYNSNFGAGSNNVFVTKVGSNDVYPSTTGIPFPNSLVKLEEILSSDKDLFSIYPNPTNGDFKIELPKGFEGKVEIRDLSGKLVYGETVHSESSQNLQMKCQNIENGNYFISIIEKDKRIVTKMILFL